MQTFEIRRRSLILSKIIEKLIAKLLELLAIYCENLYYGQKYEKLACNKVYKHKSSLIIDKL